MLITLTGGPGADETTLARALAATAPGAGRWCCCATTPRPAAGAFLRHIEPLREHCRLVVDGARAAEENVVLVWAASAATTGRSGNSRSE